jgi:hypothetical protein
MGLFDFPRIHFSGNIDINVPTINNAYYFPLTIYDQRRSIPFLPPRLYFSSKAIVDGVNSPLKPAVIPDPDNGFCYIEILPVNTIPLLRKWCMTPLGKSGAIDEAYNPFYIAASNDIGQAQGTPNFIGIAPGYWNMFGDMSVSMKDVNVTGVQTFDGTEVKTWTNDSHDLPLSIRLLLDSGVDMDTEPATGRSTAIMAETISSQSIYANIFCSRFNLFYKTDKNLALLKGKPFRFSALLYAAWRVVNWLPAMAGSARWCSAIPMEEMELDDQNTLHAFFTDYNNADARELQGVFVTFTTHEVFENRYNQDIYANGPVNNPAQATTIGSITPWYEGDMRSNIIGRNLIALNMQPIYTNTGTGNSIPVNMTPALARLHDLNNGTSIFSLDLGNSWPELMTPGFNPPNVQPAKRGDASFETYALGKISLRYGTDPSTEFAYVDINPVNNPLKVVATRGLIFDTVIHDPKIIAAIHNNLIQVYATVNGKEVQILQEADFQLVTDQKGLYAEKGDAASQGYMVYSENREPCRIRIHQNGKPVKQPMDILVAEYIVPEAGNDPQAGPDNITTQSLADNDIVTLANGALTLENTAVYYFVYPGQYPNNKIPVFSPAGYTVQDTGAFSCLKVYRKPDYDKYTNPSNPNYTPPDFDVVYNEVFKLYDVVYPVMATIHPFTKEVWDNGIMAGLTLQRTDPGIWAEALYMPRSREFSPAQRRLIKAWYNTFNESGLAPVMRNRESPLANIPQFTVELKHRRSIDGLPLVQSCAHAIYEGQLILIGGLIEGFHGLDQDKPIFGSQYENRSIWVVDTKNFVAKRLDLDKYGSKWQPLCSSSMQFVQDRDTLYIAGGYGAKNKGDAEANYTFDTLIAFSIPKLIAAVNMGLDPETALLTYTQSPMVQVAGGGLFKQGAYFYLAFGQEFFGSYDGPGKSGKYTSDVRIFQIVNGMVVPVRTCKDPALYRRDLNAVQLIQNNGTIYAGLGGVFDAYDNGFMKPVYFDPSQPDCSVKEDSVMQVTNQYDCARATIFDSASNSCFIILLGGIGQYQYHPENQTWENGDDGAKLPFVRTITQMIYSNGQMRQHIQIPPDQPEMPGLLGANAIFIPDSDLLLKDDVINYSKIQLNEMRMGLFYGGISSALPTSSALYPTDVNKDIYEVWIRKA